MSGTSGDPFFTPSKCFSTKPSEVWARGSYGLVVSRPCIVQIKRSYKRACFRALQHGYTPYRKGYLFATDVPWRLREAYRRHAHEKVKQRTPQTTPGIRCMTWNASKSLVRDEFLALVCFSAPGHHSLAGNWMEFQCHLDVPGMALYSLLDEARIHSGAHPKYPGKT